jgi:hypothetical protein
MKLGRRDVLGLKTGGKSTRQRNNGGDNGYGEMPQTVTQHGWRSLLQSLQSAAPRSFRDVPAGNFDNAMFYMNDHSARKWM